MFETLSETIRRLSALQEVDEVLDAGLAALQALIGPADALLCVGFASNGNELVPVAVVPPRARLLPHLRMPCARHASPTLPPTGTPLVGPDGVADALSCFTPEGRARLCAALGEGPPSSALWFALPNEQAILGAVLMLRPAPGPAFEAGEVATAHALADLMALAVSRLNLRRSVEQLSHMKTEVISVLSHQMRTPLATVKGYATALLMQGAEYDDATRLEFLQAIDEEADKLEALIGDILESTAIEAGLVAIEHQPVLLPHLVNEVVAEMRALAPGHRFVVSFPERFPVLHADRSRIAQVLDNLLDNAVKYSPDGGLVIVRAEVKGDEAAVCVSDQGVGIAPEHLNRLFELFFRIKGNLRRPVSGTGLGLPIARAIVEAHGGRIWAESTLGQGSALHFTLPLQHPL